MYNLIMSISYSYILRQLIGRVYCVFIVCIIQDKQSSKCVFQQAHYYPHLISLNINNYYKLARFPIAGFPDSRIPRFPVLKIAYPLHVTSIYDLRTNMNSSGPTLMSLSMSA
jgi:hypothetical protein